MSGTSRPVLYHLSLPANACKWKLTRLEPATMTFKSLCFWKIIFVVIHFRNYLWCYSRKIDHFKNWNWKFRWMAIARCDICLPRSHRRKWKVSRNISILKPRYACETLSCLFCLYCQQTLIFVINAIFRTLKKKLTYLYVFDASKVQLILKRLFDVIVWNKKPTNFF